MKNLIGKVLSKKYSVLISHNDTFTEKRDLIISEINSILLTKEILGIEINIKNE